jgi:hypothetical protein
MKPLMRYITALFLLLFAHVSRPQTRTEQPGLEQGSTQSSAQNSQQERSKLRFAALAENQPNTQAQETDAYNAAQDALYRWYLRATIAGVAVALGGLWVLWNQNRNLANQIKIQSLALRQWVDTRNWRTGISNKMDPRTLEIDVDIVNPTKAPALI